MNKKFAYALEIVWLVLAIASLIAGIHKTTITSFKESYLMFIVTFVCILMYSIRRGMRKYGNNQQD